MASTAINWTYLSKKGEDEYINRLAHSAGVEPTAIENWNYGVCPDHGLVLRGIMKHKIMKQCWHDRRPFRYMDTGYFGNAKSTRNPSGFKLWHRIVDNDLQHGNLVVKRPLDRWEQHGIPVHARRHGSKILVVAPDEKPCLFYDTTLETWLDNTVSRIKQHTDRPIEIRHRARDAVKNNRTKDKSFDAALEDDVAAVVTFNSTAAVHSVIRGVPVYVTAPTNAAEPVANGDLSSIDAPGFPDRDEIMAWLAHLAYGQFHVRELENGTAIRLLEETQYLIKRGLQS
jgi:hypothetical protein